MNNYPIKMTRTIKETVAVIKRDTSNYPKVFFVIDENIEKIYPAFIEQLIGELDRKFIVPSGEVSKSEKILFMLLSEMAQQGYTRKDLLVAVGGGVVGDLVGFAASIYMRGIDWMTVPTTLLSQIDSSVGGKTAINLPEGKNLVGSFYHPKAVWLCPLFIESLNRAELLSGMGELLKYGFLADYSMLDEIKSLMVNMDSNPVKREETIMTLVGKAIAIKTAVVLKDFKEVRERKFLNLGHSFGHAIEALENYQMPHGVCVAQGIWWILAIKAQSTQEPMAKIELKIYEDVLEGLGINRPKPYDSGDLLTFMLRDKKMDGNRIDLIQIIGPVEGQIDYSSTDAIIDRIQKQCRIQSMSVVDLEKAIQAVNSSR